MADGSKPPKGQVSEELIIVKRVMPDDAGAKGGAWKIAYADFVTAMMAFFLVMWLINAANEKTKAQVASYFNPVKLVDNTTSAKGIKTPGDRTANSSGQNGGDAVPPETAKEVSPEEKKPQDEEKEKESKAEQSAEGAKDEEKPSAEHKKEAASHAAEELALFEDPFRMLSQIARQGPGGSDGKSEKTLVINDSAIPGGSEGQPTRDPFDPLAWKLVPPAPPEPPPQAAEPPAEAAEKPAPAAETQKPEQHEPGEHQPESAGKAGETAEAPSGKAAARSEAAVKEAEAIRTALGKELSAFGGAQPDLEVKPTSEGVLISLTDSVSFDMFDVGSAKPRPVVVRLMEKVAGAVQDFKGSIIVRGHTDGRPYRGKGYDNWRLSMARAQMAYYMLIRAGVDENAVERIEGYADKALLRKDKPESAENRRIEILLKVAEP